MSDARKAEYLGKQIRSQSEAAGRPMTQDAAQREAARLLQANANKKTNGG